MDTTEARVKELDKTITARSLSETFVDPVITRTLNGDDDSKSVDRITPLDILRSASHTVIASDAEYGSTSLLNFLTMQFHRECVALDTAMVPSLIDARRIRVVYPAALTSTIRAGLPENDDGRFRLQSIHDSGRLVILIDDVDPSNTVHIDFLVAARSQYPKARLIVAIKMPFVDTRRLRPVIGIDEFDFLQLRNLTRGKVRSLVENWGLPTQYQTDAVVDEIHSRFRALGIPQTAAYVVIYLSVLQDIEGFNPINSSTIIEQFVEGVLQKYKPTYIFRSAFDYRNQIDYLAVVAERMCKDNSFAVEYSSLYEWTKQYFEDIGLEHDFAKLIQHFIDNKVFAYEGNSVYFRYNIFLSFFIAHRMQRSDEFLKWLLDDHRYTSYVTEIDIYCGLSRIDLKTLEYFGAEFARISEVLEGYAKPLSWTDRLEKLTLPIAKRDDAEAFTESITRQLTSDMGPEKRDEAVSSPNDSDDAKPDLQRKEIQGILPLWIMTLRAYTVALKNLENISRDKKEEHLKKVLQGWATVMLYACIVFKEGIENRAVQVGPIKFKLTLPANFDARLLRILFLHIPVFISDLLRRDLGSQKLALQLRNESLAGTVAESFLQSSIYADLKLDEYIGQLKNFREKAETGESLIFLEFMLIKMRDIFLRLGLNHNEQDGFLRLAAEISADIKGLKGDDRRKEIDRYTTNLRKQDQVNKLRENMT